MSGAAAAEELQRARSPHQVLVADRAASYRNIVGRTLELAGYRTAVVADGAEALRLLTTEDLVALCIVELNLPTVRGLDLLRRLRGGLERTATRVIVVTDSLAAGAREVVEELEPDAVVSKRFALSALLNAADQLLLGHAASASGPMARLDVPVDYWLGDQLQIQSCFSLSSGEMFVVVADEEPPATGTMMTLRVWLPERQRMIVCSGEVAWRNTAVEGPRLEYPPGMAVRLTDMTADDRREFDGYVR